MASAPDYDGSGVDYYTIPKFTFACGAEVSDIRIAHRVFNSTGSRGTILIPTCYGGLINTTLNFTTAPNDCLKDYRVIVVAMLGNGESSSPSNHRHFPEPGQLRYQDLVHAQHRLLTEHLHVKELEAVIGFSMGGQQAYHWAVMYPDFVKRVVSICSSARTSPHNYAFLEGPISALMSSEGYEEWLLAKQKNMTGEISASELEAVKPVQGLKAFARAYAAWLTSTHWFRERWWGMREGGLGFDSVEEWLQEREQAYSYWDAEDMLSLARMWQMANIGTVIPGHEILSQSSGKTGDDDRYKQALKSISARVLVMPCKTDQYFPPEDGEIECKYLAKGEFAPIPSIWGHTAGGGMDPDAVTWMNSQIAAFMSVNNA